MNQKKLIPLLIITAITLTIATPIAYAPGKRNDPFGDHVGNLIDERNDPTLISLANKAATSLNKVKQLEDKYQIDLSEKSTLNQLTPKDHAKLDQAITRATDSINELILESGIGEKTKTIKTEAETIAFQCLTAELARIS